MVLLLFRSQLGCFFFSLTMYENEFFFSLAVAGFGIQIKFENNLHTMKMMLALLFYTLVLLVQFKYFYYFRSETGCGV